MKTVIQDEGFDPRSSKDMQRLSYLTGVSSSTYGNIFDHVTRMPRHSTIGATISGLGYREVFVKDTKKKIDREKAIEQGIAEIKAQRKRLERHRNNGKG
jgi:hypothetical protein